MRWSPVALVPAIGLLLMLALVASVILTGSTFGQRCERLHPNDTRLQERCVEHLSNGVPDDAPAPTILTGDDHVG